MYIHNSSYGLENTHQLTNKCLINQIDMRRRKQNKIDVSLVSRQQIIYMINESLCNPPMPPCCFIMGDMYTLGQVTIQPVLQK